MTIRTRWLKLGGLLVLIAGGAHWHAPNKM